MPTFHRSSAGRSASVERSLYSSSYGSSSSSSSRSARATTVGPCRSSMYENPDYYGYMPFNRSLTDIEDRIKLRGASLEPVSTYRRSYYSSNPYGGCTSYDYKVWDYASKLDDMETTRNYMNTLRSSYQLSSMQPALGTLYDSYLNRQSSYGARYNLDDRMAARKRISDLSNYRVDSRDLYSYKHYRKSNQTLTDRNTRAKSPILSRELDRYYKTERRSDYLGDISSGGQRDFRYYNYRQVPYYGGSDYYTNLIHQYRAGSAATTAVSAALGSAE